jgi:antibiotic biosynthesis monooxygenase (ABM) superfamily enzyme
MDKPTKDLQVTALVTNLNITAPDGRGIDWLIELMFASSGFPGLLSMEIIPPLPQENTWTLVQRFRTSDQLESWKQSAERQKLSNELAPLLLIGGITFSEAEVASYDSRSSATAAIVTDLKPGMRTDYCAWLSKLQQIQIAFPGYRGSYVQPPSKSNPNQWTTLIRFDSPDTLDNWFNSEVREELLAESESFIQSRKFHWPSTSLIGWFPADAKTGKRPPNWKTSLMVLLGLYPVAMLTLKFITPFLTWLPKAPMIFVRTGCSVALVTMLMVPLANHLFKWWLFPQANKTLETNLKGLAIIASAFAIEILLLWNI